MRKGYNWLIVSVVGVVLIIAVVLVVVFAIPVAIKAQVSKTIVLNNGSDAWKRWVDTPVPIYLNMTMFIVANPYEVMNHGATPNLTERGPYVYRETRHKEVVSINQETDTITYYQRILYEFDKKMSGDLDENDHIMVLNPMLVGLAQIIESMPFVDLLESLLDYGLTDILGTNHLPLMNTTVRELLFDGFPLYCNQSDPNGATLMLCAAFKHLMPLKFIFPEGDNYIFALVRYKNNTRDGPYEVYRGSDEIKDLGKIIKYHGVHKGTAWTGDPCNIVRGSDVALLPPFLDVDSDLFVFSSDICASMKMNYVEKSVYKDIHGLRFSPTKQFLGSVYDFSENYCYTPGKTRGIAKRNALLKAGAWDITGCLGMPAVLSYPHFHRADDYLGLVHGLKYDPSKHYTYIDVEPTTGTPLRGYQRVQLNLMTTSTPTIQRLAGLPTTLFPIFWFEEGFELPDKELSLIRDQLLKVLKIIEIVQWVLIGVGIVMAVVGGGLAAFYLLRDRKYGQSLSG